MECDMKLDEKDLRAIIQSIDSDGKLHLAEAYREHPDVLDRPTERVTVTEILYNAKEGAQYLFALGFIVSNFNKISQRVDPSKTPLENWEIVRKNLTSEYLEPLKRNKDNI
jgi:hypothetical protein